MKLATVIAIVQRDRALELLRSQHPLLAHAASLYTAASHAFHPWPAAHSVDAFDHWILAELRGMGPDAVELKALGLLLGMLQATAFEHLAPILRAREPYAALLQRIAHPIQARRKYPSAAQMDQTLLEVSTAFEHAALALERARPPHTALWSEVDGLKQRIRQLRFLRGRMDSAARHARRREAARRALGLQRCLFVVCVLSASLAVLGLAQLMLVR